MVHCVPLCAPSWSMRGFSHAPASVRALRTEQRPLCPGSQLAVEEVLVPPPASAAPSVLRSHLQLLAEAYRRTLHLADRLHDAGGADVKTKARGMRCNAPRSTCATSRNDT